MNAIKKIGLVLVLMFITHIGFAQTATGSTTVSPNKQVKGKPTQAQQLALEHLASITAANADSIISYDGVIRVAVPNKKIAIEKP